ncbi:hypothetical protein KUH32_18355 [Thalassococcus sp. CAU 1522]|uniref:DUF3311 domain-containing protein n=1 Tax=Thalassococcus arenae TaxID=2851652 RepID=A0ABS6NCH4_9RHOB|nr:hypothetical protein [Thalassococcus arenae]MBV2361732.1 hypothetical protein [Thalassococcus arenae]
MSRDTDDWTGAPLFVERRAYRRRRAADAARALPVLALFLWMLPLFWRLGTDDVMVSGALVYIFAIWIGVIVAAAALAFRIAPERQGDVASDRDEDGP